MTPRLMTADRPAGAPWSIAAAAQYLDISERHLHRLIADGDVRAIRIGRRVLLADAEVRRLASEGTTTSTGGAI